MRFWGSAATPKWQTCDFGASGWSFSQAVLIDCLTRRGMQQVENHQPFLVGFLGIYFHIVISFKTESDPSPAGDIRKHSTRPSSLLRDHVLGEKQPNSIPFTFHPDHFEAGFPQASQNHHLWREPTHDSGFHSSWNSQDPQMKTRNRLPRVSQSRRFWGIPFQAALCFI